MPLRGAERSTCQGLENQTVKCWPRATFHSHKMKIFWRLTSQQCEEKTKILKLELFPELQSWSILITGYGGVKKKKDQKTERIKGQEWQRKKRLFRLSEIYLTLVCLFKCHGINIFFQSGQWRPLRGCDVRASLVFALPTQKLTFWSYL